MVFVGDFLVDGDQLHYEWLHPADPKVSIASLGEGSG